MTGLGTEIGKRGEPKLNTVWKKRTEITNLLKGPMKSRGERGGKKVQHWISSVIDRKTFFFEIVLGLLYYHKIFFLLKIKPNKKLLIGTFSLHQFKSYFRKYLRQTKQFR